MQICLRLAKALHFPDAKALMELMEYEDYITHPTKANASTLISLALEENRDWVQSIIAHF